MIPDTAKPVAKWKDYRWETETLYKSECEWYLKQWGKPGTATWDKAYYDHVGTITTKADGKSHAENEMAITAEAAKEWLVERKFERAVLEHFPEEG